MQLDNNIDINGSQELELVDLSATGRRRHWKEKKLGNELLAYTYENIDKKKAERLKKCAEWLMFLQTESGGLKLTKANFCRIRLCPLCAWRRSMKIYANMNKIMNKMNEEDYAYIFLTLTVRNVQGADLNEQITQMMSGWNRLASRPKFKRIVKGWYRGLEVTHNTDWTSNSYDTYHPHFHCVIAVNPSYFTDKTYLSREKWQTMWKECMRLDYDPMVDVRRIKGNTAKAVCEATKYTVKDNDYIIPDDLDLSESAVRVLDEALANRRLVAFGGRMKELHKQLKLDDEVDGDLIHTDTEEEEEDKATQTEIYFTWNVGLRTYIKA